MGIQEERSTPAPQDKDAPAPQDKDAPAPQDKDTPAKRGNELRQFALDHPTLLVSVSAALIFAIRCFAVTNRNLDVTYILIAQTSVADAIRGLLFSALPLVLIAVASLAGFLAGRRDKWLHVKTVALLTAGVAAGLANEYMFRGSWFWDVLLLVLGFFLGRETKSPTPKERSERSQRIFHIILFFVAMYSVVLSTVLPVLSTEQFWLPPERLVFEDGEPIFGYVLRSEGDYFVIMNDDPRVIIERTGTPKERDFCYHERNPVRSSELAANSPLCPIETPPLEWP